ncbi:hypothetical protein JW960_22125 [candidate division KSB1 bacterium]|nr:hypothetical protein [candidate division KSB1 bacterium]
MELTKQELEQYNGQDGKPAYVAVDGKIYDVTESKLWKNGKHMNRHFAGTDLSNAFEAAPHGKETVQKYPQVGTLKQDAVVEKPPVPDWLINFFDKYPFLKRHPHPMVVHFPMAFFITSSLFLGWYYLISPIASLLDAIFYMHILGTMSLPFAIATGWVSWKYNYFGKRIGYITRKIIMTSVVLVFDIIVLVSMIYQPDILVHPQGIQILLPIFIFSYLPIVSAIGHHGGQLVY